MTTLDVARENERLERATPEERLAFAVDTFGEDLLFTSSFGAGSGVLLHLWSRVARHLPVVFIDTGFLFDETHAYKDRLARELGLTVRVVRPELPPEEFLWRHGGDVMSRDPDFCCACNKVEPIAPLVARARAWVSGLRRDQSKTREHVAILEPSAQGPIKVHPIATMTAAEARAYMEANGVGEHPLRAKKYLSIGCWPCTRPVGDDEDERAGRWAGHAKTECGLHAISR